SHDCPKCDIDLDGAKTANLLVEQGDSSLVISKPRARRASRAFARIGIAVVAVASTVAGTTPAHAVLLQQFYVRPQDPAAAMSGITAFGGVVTPLNIQGGFLAHDGQQPALLLDPRGEAGRRYGLHR